jgi:hypothetical protein
MPLETQRGLIHNARQTKVRRTFDYSTDTSTIDYNNGLALIVVLAAENTTSQQGDVGRLKIVEIDGAKFYERFLVWRCCPFVVALA